VTDNTFASDSSAKAFAVDIMKELAELDLPQPVPRVVRLELSSSMFEALASRMSRPNLGHTLFGIVLINGIPVYRVPELEEGTGWAVLRQGDREWRQPLHRCAKKEESND